MARTRLSLGRKLLKTVCSLWGALVDWGKLRFPRFRSVFKDPMDFSFLVHPRTNDFVGTDVYGENDIFRPYPAFPLLFRFLPKRTATRLISWYAGWVVPITLSRITLDVRRGKRRRLTGSLLSTVRTPRMLYEGGGATRLHMQDLYELAHAQGAARVGLGALLPSMTKYGKAFHSAPGYPARSTGHAYTGYVICQFLEHLIRARGSVYGSARVAVVGAAGSTGLATLRMMKALWPTTLKIELVLVDLPQKMETLQKRAAEMSSVCRTEATLDHQALRECEYVIVVTAGSGAQLSAEHLSPGTVIIDDSQPRNTGVELREAGCFVVDVLARVPGLDCNFDFGFNTRDPSVTFTCLAETVIAAAVGFEGDLALGEVTDLTVQRVLRMVLKAKRLGLIGELPFFSFGRELTTAEKRGLLHPRVRVLSDKRPAAE